MIEGDGREPGTSRPPLGRPGPLTLQASITVEHVIRDEDVHGSSSLVVQAPSIDTGVTLQTRRQYSWMERSEENLPIRATLRMEALVQAGTTCHRASMPRWAS